LALRPTGGLSAVRVFVLDRLKCRSLDRFAADERLIVESLDRLACRLFEAALGGERTIPHELNEDAVPVRVASLIIVGPRRG
jgi:hypothetical protein